MWVNAIGMVLATATLTNLIVGCQKPSRPAPPPPAVTVANPLQKEITDWNEYTGGPTAAESPSLASLRSFSFPYSDSLKPLSSFERYGENRHDADKSSA